MKVLSVLLICIWLGSGSAHAFTHPGIPLTKADLDQVKANLNKEPWKSAYAALQDDGHSSLQYQMLGPFEKVSRNDYGQNTNGWQWKSDMQAVFNLSLMWYFTGNADYAQKAHDILIAWATTQTAYTGVEASFDLGDCAYCYAGGADILRGTWSGWTESDTTTVQNYFNNVFWSCLGFPGPMATGSQGMEALTAAVAIAVFDDDQAKLNQVLNDFLYDGDSALRDSLPNGQIGDTGRDQGHTSLFIYDLAFIAEVFWKQGIDVFSVLDNRILAASEYYSRYNFPGPTPSFVSFGAPFWGTFGNISGAPRSSGQSRRALNIIHGAYVVRKGMSAPWTTQYRQDQAEDAMSFLFLKSADSSTATPPAMSAYPSAASVTKDMTNADLNGCSPAGNGEYNNGVWTLAGGYSGQDPWNSGTPTVHFTYKQVVGDFTMIARVDSVSDVGSPGAKAGIMLRDSADGNASNQAWVAIAPRPSYERGLRGWTALPYGSNASSLVFGIQRLPYWVKMERVGTRIQTFVSADGGSWSPAGTADFANIPDTLYVGLFGTSLVEGTTTTATFSNVCLTGGDGGAGVTTPAAPSAIFTSPADGQVMVRWTESFGATTYNIYRAAASGGPYEKVATTSNTACIDANVKNGTTYYYVVRSSNSAGESGNSLEDSAKPEALLMNIALNGEASASIGSQGAESSDKAFDINPGSKWFSGADAGSSGWLQYDLGTAKIIKAYSITSANDVPERDPKNWEFQGSNDGAEWTTLDEESGQNFVYRYQTVRYPLKSPANYRYYRLNITPAMVTMVFN